MKKLVIAVDCDDVLIESMKFIIGRYNLLYDTSIALKDAQIASRLQGIDRHEVHKRVNNILLSDEYAKLKPSADAITAIRTLAKDHELHLLTARPPALADVTNKMLDKYFPRVFRSIEHVGEDGNKGAVCRQLQASVIIDDNNNHLQNAQRAGVKHLLWYGDYEWQDAETIKDMSGVTRCLNWKEVVEVIDGIARS